MSEYDAGEFDDIAQMGDETGQVIEGAESAARNAARIAHRLNHNIKGSKQLKKASKKGKDVSKKTLKLIRQIIGALSGTALLVFGLLFAFVLIIIILVCANSSSGSSSNGSTTTNNFVARLASPDGTNQFYFSDMNVFYASGWGMPNCTAYAYGRAYELLGTKPNLSSGNAEDWFDYNKAHNYYPYGDTPKLGAIACWSHDNGGHVAVVEKIEDNTITFSNSGYPSTMFYTNEISANDSNASYNDSWNLLGYIYIYSESENGTITPTNVNGVAQKITTFFTSHGLNLAATCGILGNIQQECSFDEYWYFAEYVADAGGASGNSGGICMWYGENNARFRRDCPNWNKSVDAQIEYLYQTMIKDGQGSYDEPYYYWCTGCWEKLRAIPNTRDGAIQAAIIFRDYYERPELSLAGPREEYAADFWDKIH